MLLICHCRRSFIGIANREQIGVQTLASSKRNLPPLTHECLRSSSSFEIMIPYGSRSTSLTWTSTDSSSYASRRSVLFSPWLRSAFRRASHCVQWQASCQLDLDEQHIPIKVMQMIGHTSSATAISSWPFSTLCKNPRSVLL